MSTIYGEGYVADMMDKCICETCMPFDIAKPETLRFIVCAICGNKRCPHATDHRNACTNSNDPGQKGSSWEHYKSPGRTAE
jgi:hypothetical protein